MKFLLSQLSVFPSGLAKVLKSAKEIGFDGVELFLFLPTLRRWVKYVKMAVNQGLSIHFHEAFSAKEATTPSLFFDLLESFGFLPTAGTKVVGGRVPHLYESTDARVVMYANHCLGHCDGRYGFQTISTLSNDGHFETSYVEFLRQFRRFKMEVVIDTYHLLEWYYGKPDNLESVNQSDFLGVLTGAFDQFRGYVSEIHLADWDPEKGRNCLIGRGVLPLREFCSHVVKSGWNGVVVPEVNPKHLLFHRKTKLRTTLLTAKSLFGQ